MKRLLSRNERESKSVGEFRIPFIWGQSDASLSSLRQGLIVVSRLQRVGPFEQWAVGARGGRGDSTFLAKQRNTLRHHFHYTPKLISCLD